MLTYALKLAQRYDGMVLATFPDVPDAVALGRDHEEACEEALCALEAALARCQASGRELPAPRASGNLSVTTEKFGLLAPA